MLPFFRPMRGPPVVSLYYYISLCNNDSIIYGFWLMKQGIQSVCPDILHASLVIVRVKLQCAGKISAIRAG